MKNVHSTLPSVVVCFSAVKSHDGSVEPDVPALVQRKKYLLSAVRRTTSPTAYSVSAFHGSLSGV